MGPIVELRHLIVLPRLKSVRKESCSLWVQGTDGLFWEGGVCRKTLYFYTMSIKYKKKKGHWFLKFGINAQARLINAT